MIEKYYTPTIEEFHVGFEFELAYSFTKNGVRQEDLLVEHTIEVNSDLELIQEQIKENLIRVKYLDREDIESLGFKTIYSVQSDFYKSIYSNEICRIRTITQSIITVCISVKNQFYMPEVFRGEIKNKSELRKLLKQLEIK